MREGASQDKLASDDGEDQHALYANECSRELFDTSEEQWSALLREDHLLGAS